MIKTKGQLLILDDEETLMRALCDTLRDHGFDTIGFTSAEDALEELKAGSYDIVLTDLNMPEIDGISLLQRAHVIDENLMGIIMTGQGSIDSAVDAMKNGALDYILKPFKLNTILPVLSRALTLRRLRIENIQLTEHLKERTEELELMNKDLEAFSYSVSHDLRSPVAMIQNICVMIREEYKNELDVRFAKLFQNIQNNCLHMERLIEDLLTFFKSGRGELKKEKFDLKEMIKEVIELAILPGSKAKIEIDSLPFLYGDKTLLFQVLSNLISNAYKYSSKEKNPIIQIGSASKKGRFTIHIKDNGDGFDMKYAEKLFEPFQRLHTDKDFQGSGVGLAIVKRIINRHGGQIWAISEKGKGSEFYFSIPEG